MDGSVTAEETVATVPFSQKQERSSMTTKSVTMLKTALASQQRRSRFGLESPADLETGGDSGEETGRQKMVADFLNPGCEHDWVKRSKVHQTLETEGKTIWQCRTCDEMTSTYDWQTPAKNR